MQFNSNDINGKPMSRRDEQKAVEDYKKETKKEWNFPFREAFKKIGLIK